MYLFFFYFLCIIFIFIVTRGAVPDWLQSYAKKTMEILFNSAADCSMPVGFLSSSKQFNDLEHHYRIFWTAANPRADTMNSTNTKVVYERSLELIGPFRLN